MAHQHLAALVVVQSQGQLQTAGETVQFLGRLRRCVRGNAVDAAVGFGEKPTLIALFLYGLLPIFENTLTGLTTLPPWPRVS